MSPEEVIVPFAVFSKIMAEPKEILVNLGQNTFRYSVKSTILFNLGNVNDYEISNVEIAVKNSNIECEYIKIKQIKAKEKNSIEMTARFKKTISREERENLMVSIKYDFLGKAYTNNINFRILMKAIIEEKTNLDDIFN